MTGWFRPLSKRVHRSPRRVDQRGEALTEGVSKVKSSVFLEIQSGVMENRVHRGHEGVSLFPGPSG